MRLGLLLLRSPVPGVASLLPLGPLPHAPAPLNPARLGQGGQSEYPSLRQERGVGKRGAVDESLSSKVGSRGSRSFTSEIEWFFQGELRLL